MPQQHHEIRRLDTTDTMISRWPRLLSLASGPRNSFLLITMATPGTIVLDIISISRRVLDREGAS